MRQRVDGRLPRLRQKTSETLALSDMNISPVAFNLNQMSALVLPLVSDSKRLVWVHSNQFNLQLDGAAELDKAFDQFPYLTQSQTAALAQRCSLHPDQVKVWFMLQRLRYGISWDYKDILKVQRKIKSSQGKEELQEDAGENNKMKREGKESGGKSANEGRMTGENMSSNEPLERKMKPVKEDEDRKVELEDDKGNTHKDQKRMTLTDKKGNKRRADEGVVERAEEVEITSNESTNSKPTQPETTLFTRKKKAAKAYKPNQRWPALKSLIVHDEALDVHPPLIPLSKTFDVPPLTDNQTPNTGRTPVKSSFEETTKMDAKLEGESHAAPTNRSAAVTDVGKLEELREGTDKPAGGCTRVRATKTQTQLAMMKMAFVRCQYPNREDYNRLEMLIGLPRYTLVQWFGDMRYYVKKGRPRWMSQEQHSQALANIRYRQCLITLAKAQQSEGCGKATWKMKLEKYEGCGEDETVQVPPE